jgi:hypothetical protein
MALAKSAGLQRLPDDIHHVAVTRRCSSRENDVSQSSS